MEEKSTYVISSPQGELEEVVEEEQYKVMSKKRSSTMENPPHGKSNSKSSKQPKTENQASKKRKMIEKTVVTVRIEANVGTQKNEGPPSDFWSWRKYGQKPIKGSPYPRGYYRCSTSKGCSAKKQVERCRTDASILIVTYTSNHNHPGPDIHSTNQINQETSSSPRSQSTSDDQEELPNTPKEEPPTSFISKDHHDQELTSSHEDHHHFHYFQYSDPLDDMIHLQGENPLTIDKTHDSSSLLLEEEPLSYPNLMTFSSSSSSSSTPKSEENDFFDELEELPTFSNFKSFMRNTFFDERILVFPS